MKTAQEHVHGDVWFVELVRFDIHRHGDARPYMRIPGRDWPELRVAYALVDVDEGEILLERRPPT